MIKHWWEGIKRWFSWYLVTKDAYEWDSVSILELEQEQLKRIHDYISKYQSYTKWKYDIWKINICLNLLDIILSEVDIVETIDTDINSLGNIHKCKCIPYVNINNANRFLNTNFINSNLPIDLIKSELYEEKAWRLYHKLRMRYMRDWWC